MGICGELVIINSQRLKEEVLPAFLDGYNNSFVKTQRAKFIEEVYITERQRPSFEHIELIFRQLDSNYLFSNIEKNFTKSSVYSNGDWNYEDLVTFFEFVLRNTCYEKSYKFGTSLITLGQLSTRPFNIGNYLINKLSNPDCFWCHKYGNKRGCEGIQGWLYEDELILLEGKIKTIGFYEDGLIDNEEIENTVSKLRMYLQESLQLNKGVLWGGDLRWFY